MIYFSMSACKLVVETRLITAFKYSSLKCEECLFFLYLTTENICSHIYVLANAAISFCANCMISGYVDIERQL